MQKVKWIVILAVVCILAMSISAYAQVPTANWPKSGRDYYNSSHSPATVIAKPVPKWITTVSSNRAWRDAQIYGLAIDSQGNIYTEGDYAVQLNKYEPVNGNLVWAMDQQTPAVPDASVLGVYNGCALSEDANGNKYVVLGPLGYASGSYPEGRSIYWVDQNTGQLVRNSTASLMTSLYCSIVGATASAAGLVCSSNPAIGPDGTVYTDNLKTSNYDSIGPLFAFNPLDATRKWCEITAANTGDGLGNSYGSPAIRVGAGTINGIDCTGKTVIYESGGLYKETADSHPAVEAWVDNGSGVQPTLLWKRSLTGSYQGFTTSHPVLSNDASTLYVAGREAIPIRRANVTVAYPTSTNPTLINTLFALNADTGAVKWAVKTDGRHAYQPTLGPNNMIYLSGGVYWTGAQSDCPAYKTPGKVIAVQDNGSTGTVKWTLSLPDDEVGDTTSVVTISTTPTTMYVAGSSGRLYCIQDLGNQAKVLWTYAGVPNPTLAYNKRGMAPANIVVADDGTIYTQWGTALYAFQPGFNPSSPEGISGTVKDSAGNPIAGAWVAASTSPQPLADNASRLWTKTNADGTYQISPKDTGTYYVAAAAVDYEGSTDQTVSFTAITDKITCSFTLGKAKYNWAFMATATTNSANTNTSLAPSYAVDGYITGSTQTRFASAATNAWLQIDLGAERTISEAVIYWWYEFGRAYSLEYSNDGSTWNAVYTTTAGNGGFPLEYLAADPLPQASGINGTATTIIGPGGIKTGADVIKFPATAAQYWRVNYTSASNLYTISKSPTYPRSATADGKTATVPAPATYASICEIELRDATKPGVPHTPGGARSLDNGAIAIVDEAVVTAAPDGGGTPTDTIFIESTDRIGGIRVQKTGLSGIKFGDRVSVRGTVATNSDGEKYIDAGTITRLTTTTDPDGPAPADVAMNNKAAADAVSQGLLIDTWGSVSDVGTSSFMISDGSATAIKVLCGSAAKPADDDYVRVRGVVGKDVDGPVLYMRNERADWVYGADDMHALPFTGTFDYPIQYLVLGPFTDSSKTQEELLDYDFIGEATIAPQEGMVTAGKTWSRATSADGILDLNSVLGTTTANSVAYVHLYVWSETEAPDVALATGSDSSLKYFVNYTEAFRLSTTRTCTIDSELQGITLHKGVNNLLFKVVSDANGFKLSSQIIDGIAFGVTGYGGYTPYVTTGLGYSLNYVAP